MDEDKEEKGRTSIELNILELYLLLLSKLFCPTMEATTDRMIRKAEVSGKQKKLWAVWAEPQRFSSRLCVHEDQGESTTALQKQKKTFHLTAIRAKQ
jgi:hypothetical protein